MNLVRQPGHTSIAYDLFCEVIPPMKLISINAIMDAEILTTVLFPNNPNYKHPCSDLLYRKVGIIIRIISLSQGPQYLKLSAAFIHIG
jgi:hypothetical protein